MKDDYTNSQAVVKTISLEEALKPPDGRTSDHLVLNGSINANKLGDIITGNPASTNLGSGISSGLSTIPNAMSLSFIFAVNDEYNRVIIAVPDIAIYVGSLDDANLYPNASYGYGNLPIAIYNDWALTDNVGVVTRVIVRNNTGAPVDVYVICRWRIITNSTAALQGLTDPTIAQV